GGRYSPSAGARLLSTAASVAAAGVTGCCGLSHGRDVPSHNATATPAARRVRTTSDVFAPRNIGKLLLRSIPSRAHRARAGFKAGQEIRGRGQRSGRAIHAGESVKVA